MISFSDRVVMSSLTNLVSEREELEASSPGPWPRLYDELIRLQTRQSNLQVLTTRIDEFFGMSAEQVAASAASDSDASEFVRDEQGNIETTTTGVYERGY